MGYCMTQVGCEGFKIKKSDQIKALNALKEICEKKDANYAWVDKDVVLKAKNLNDAMVEWGWETEEDKKDDITLVRFIGEKLGEDYEMFYAIAPYVKKGAYIEMSGEDGTLWRWIFNGKKCIEKTAKVTY